MTNKPSLKLSEESIFLRLSEDDREGGSSRDIKATLDESDFGVIGFEVINLKHQLGLKTISIENFEDEHIRMRYSPQDDTFSVILKSSTDRYRSSRSVQAKVSVSTETGIINGFQIPIRD